MRLTKKEVEILKVIIGTELKMIQFIKGFDKHKTPYEMFLDGILKKLNTLVNRQITVEKGKYKDDTRPIRRVVK